MKYFSKEYKNFPLHNDEHLNLTLVESKGADLEDMLINANISIEDWHGNTACEGWDLGDLSKQDYEHVMQDFIEFLNGAHDEN
jgi:hypothetical protein